VPFLLQRSVLSIPTEYFAGDKGFILSPKLLTTYEFLFRPVQHYITSEQYENQLNKQITGCSAGLSFGTLKNGVNLLS
jgi:hypothetical protein